MPGIERLNIRRVFSFRAAGDCCLRPFIRFFPTVLKRVVLTAVTEIAWVVNATLVLLILPCIVKIKREGNLSDPPFILCATHVGELDPVIVMRASRHYRARAIFERDDSRPFVRLFLKAVYRFQVTQRPELKPLLNAKTTQETVFHLKRGGILMVFPEGSRYWERKLFPGVAVMAHRADVPVVPTGIEHGDVCRKELLATPLRAMITAIRDYHRLGHVVVHFTEVIHPDADLEEREDVDRVMGLIEERFGEFYRRFYKREGPVWIGRSKLDTDKGASCKSVD